MSARISHSEMECHASFEQRAFAYVSPLCFAGVGGMRLAGQACDLAVEFAGRAKGGAYRIQECG